MSERAGLGLSTASPCTFETFFVGDNKHAIARSRKGRRVWLFGERATGKTHILQSLATQEPRALAVSAENIKQLPAVSVPLVLVDDIESLLGEEALEYSLFEALESTDFGKTRWVVAAQQHTTAIPCVFTDLASRLSAFECTELMPVPQSRREELLNFWAADRSISLGIGAVKYLLDRVPRTQQDLWDTLIRLDTAAVLKERELSIPFIREVLEIV